MIICGVILVITIALSFAKLWNKRTAVLIVAGAALCFILSAADEIASYGENVASIEKNEIGEGSSERELTAQTEDGRKIKVHVTVPEKSYGNTEAEKILDSEINRLDGAILGDNVSFDNICRDMKLPETGENRNVTIEWTSLNPDVISSDGIIQDEVTKEGAEAVLNAVLKLGSVEREYEKRIRVYPNAARNGLEAEIQKELKRQSEDAGGESYILPQSADGERLIWREQPKSTYAVIAFVLLVIGLLMRLNSSQREEERRRKRNECLKNEYPELISRLLLMLCSGTGARTAFFKTASLYVKSKEKSGKCAEAFEELLTACRQMESGSSEEEAYERMAESCELPCYRKLSVLLIQNGRRGGKGFIDALEQEAAASLGDRKRAAETAGEAASLKLLIPLGMMLIVALAVMMIPAFMAM